MKTRFFLPLATLALMTIGSCNRHQGNTVEDKPLDCNVVPSEVLGGNHTAADLKFYRVVDSQDDIWNMYLRCVGELPEGLPIGIYDDGRITSKQADTAAFAEHAKNICMQMCNDANEYSYVWRSPICEEDSLFELVLLNREPLPLGGKDVVEAKAVESSYNGEPVLEFVFSEQAAKIWEKITEENMGHRIAFLFAGKVLSTPMVSGKIEGGKCSVSGLSTEETCALAKVLNQ